MRHSLCEKNCRREIFPKPQRGGNSIIPAKIECICSEQGLAPYRPPWGVQHIKRFVDDLGQLAEGFVDAADV